MTVGVMYRQTPGIVVVRGECLNETLVKTGVARVTEYARWYKTAC